MKNNANLLIAAVLMMGFLMFWDSAVMSRYGSKSKPVPAAPASAPDSQISEAPAETRSKIENRKSKPNPVEETLTVLETADAKVSFLSKGARVASWQIREREHWIELVMPEKKRVVSPLETFKDVNFAAKKKSDTEAVFNAELPSGVTVEKDIRLLAKPPFHLITLSFSNPAKSSVEIKTELPFGNGIDKHDVGSAYDEKDENGVVAENRVAALANQVKQWKPGFIFGRTVDLFDPAVFKWVGVDNSHFLFALLPTDDKGIQGLRVVADRVYPPMGAVPINLTLQPGQTMSFSYRLYAGPKEYSQLAKIGDSLEKSVNFGFFGPIAKLLLKALLFFHSLTGNYGWAIILLTFAIQILVFPLTRKNLQHAARMRELQPQLKKLQEQFKSDPKRQQVETFNLYKRNGMKFMGLEGCFPMLMQIPIFIAFYATLHTAYELRGAPWIFWIHDLGTHDPFYVLPIIMGLGMLLQQKMTAVAVDPAQARMMMFMPIIFTFMFLKLPAGLVLYWCVNSLTTIVITRLLSSGPSQPIQAGS